MTSKTGDDIKKAKRGNWFQAIYQTGGVEKGSSSPHSVGTADIRQQAFTSRGPRQLCKHSHSA